MIRMPTIISFFHVHGKHSSHLCHESDRRLSTSSQFFPSYLVKDIRACNCLSSCHFSSICSLFITTLSPYCTAWCNARLTVLYLFYMDFRHLSKSSPAELVLKWTGSSGCANGAALRSNEADLDRGLTAPPPLDTTNRPCSSYPTIDPLSEEGSEVRWEEEEEEGGATSSDRGRRRVSRVVRAREGEWKDG